MKRGLDEQGIREAAAYLCGRIEREIEAFAASVSLPTMAFTSRVAQFLSGQGSGDAGYLPHLPVEAGTRGAAVAEVEEPLGAHGNGSRGQRLLAPGNAASQAAAHKVTRRLSPEGLERIRQASKRRWAKAKKAGVNAHTGKALKPKAKDKQPKNSGSGSTIKEYWQSMTVEQRKAEMQRRMAVRQANAKQ